MLYDVYVLASERTISYAEKFISAWTYGFEAAAEEYEFPQYAKAPEIIFSTASQLIERLILNSQQPHAIYWHNSNEGDTRDAMLFFTTDGGMIVGLSVEVDKREDARKFLEALAADVDGEFGMVMLEQPPADSAEEFIREVADWPSPKLFRSKIE